ncbi:Ubiquitin-conjugating enzyme E2-binding protein [Phaffia rhodozyma]|uniref:Ubiquitin-conjugating enzyme E2-binding protein n=1 Tax=Phaffia rhodozyma TaxID=264483 RepID=A0A0F7SE65_PHARH|nr:Ubiquitin-conjugating enzyme E2-binding protein [Phaffia rhodozyma]
MAALQHSQSKSEPSDETMESPIYTISTPAPFDRVAPSPFPVDELQSFQQTSSQHVSLGSISAEPQSITTAHPLREQLSGSPPGYAFLSSQDDLSLSDKSIPPGYDDQSPSTFCTARPKHTPSGSPSRQLSYNSDQEISSEKKELKPDPKTWAIDRFSAVDSCVDDQKTDAESSKLIEMDLAKMIGRGRMHDQSSEFLAGKGKERSIANEELDGEVKNRELLDIWEKIERAHGTRLDDQSFALLDSQLTEARPEPSIRRIHGSPSLEKDPSEMITADQFIQEKNSSRSTSPATKSSFLPMGSSAERPLLLKTNSNHNEDSLSEPRYSLVAEHQASINIIQLTLLVEYLESFPSTSSPTYELKIPSSNPSLGYIRDLSSQRRLWTFQLPAPSRQSDDSLVFTRSHSSSNPQTYTLRLPSATSTRSESHQHVQPLSIHSLRTSRSKSLNCSECSAKIIDFSDTAREDFHELPSEHWEELIESWLCCSSMELDLGSGKAGEQKEGKDAEKIFWPKAKEILGGEGYLLVEQEMVREGVWAVRHGGSTEIWQPIVCSICSFPLGRRFIHSPQSSTFKFTKYSLALTESEQGLGSIHAGRGNGQKHGWLQQFVAAEMRALADAHRCYHFVLLDEEQQQEGAFTQNEGIPRILIWMLNANLDLTVRSFGPIQGTHPEDQPESVPHKAIKVLYLPLTPTSAIPSTFPLSKAEYLPYPKIICDRLEAALDRSWNFYPREAREMMGLRMSWLERT